MESTLLLYSNTLTLSLPGLGGWRLSRFADTFHKSAWIPAAEVYCTLCAAIMMMSIVFVHLYNPSYLKPCWDSPEISWVCWFNVREYYTYPATQG